MVTSTRIPLPGTTNLRDLGGLPGAGGAIVAPGRLLRGEVLGQPGNESLQGEWDPACAADYGALGLRTVVDLRSDHELARTPSAWEEATGAVVVRVPLAEGGEGTDTDFVRQLLAGERTGFSAEDLGTFYIGTLTSRARQFAEIVDLLSDPERLPALVHCSAGKDRTGLAVALVLELLGAPREVVVEDYAFTGVLRPDRVNAYVPMFRDAGADALAARALFETPAPSMRAALSHLDDAYGGAETYLVEVGGLDPGAPSRLRAALLVPHGPVTEAIR